MPSVEGEWADKYMLTCGMKCRLRPDAHCVLHSSNEKQQEARVEIAKRLDQAAEGEGKTSGVGRGDNSRRCRT